MLQESAWRDFGFDEEAIAKLAHRVLVEHDKPRLGLIARDQFEVFSGVMVAEIDDLEWVCGRRAINVFTFVPQQRSGGITGARLLRAFLDWAKEHEVDSVEFGVSSGVRLSSSDRLLRAFGFQRVESTFLCGDKRY